ncbi:hypothetical protein QRE66_12255 [Bacillus cereus]|nr:hypothetical protein QRE66_12255 [Bacillus cereus]
MLTSIHGIAAAETTTTTNSSKLVKQSVQAAPTDGWYQDNGKWYYYRNGLVQKDWQSINNAWYYFDSSGIMLVGWQSIKGIW